MSPTPSPAPLRLGIAGLGTVGIGVVKIVQNHPDLIALRSGRPVQITAICARDRTRNRDADLSGYAWVDRASDLALRDDVDVVVELIGGDEGPARELIELALENGKDVVTAATAISASPAPTSDHPGRGAVGIGARRPARNASPAKITSQTCG